MNAQISGSALAPPPPRLAAAPVLRTIVICDLADSTAVVEQLGDSDSAELMRRHDRLVRDLLRRHDGREIDKTDGFLMLFDRPIGAVAFALDYQRELHRLAREEKFPLRARVGVHVGDVVLWQNADADIERGAKPVEAEGLVKAVAARVTSIARPGQILLSGIAASLARRAQGELGSLPALRWHNHGNYRFKGVPEVVPVFEVGEDGVAPFKPPAWTGKAHREVPWWRRPGSLAIEATVLIAAIAIPAYFSLRTPPAIAFANRDWAVVGDLRNLTGQSIFDDSVQTAFRIGLEQSQHINLVSDLKARETLRLMQRDPEKTPIDRGVGSEVAIREGARALILPSVAEIGGRVRVTAEVVDPQTQTTVYSESADGIGTESVLSSLDMVNARLRVRLGEALTSVTKESQPLERAATKSLDALKAYTLGWKAYSSGLMQQAMDYYQQALKVDPEFALARVQVAQIYNNANQYSEAAQQIAFARSLQDRLGARDKLYVDAWAATFASRETALSKWKMLRDLYPDYFPAHGLYGQFAWHTNHFADAIEAVSVSASPRNPRAVISRYMLGILYLSRDRFADASAEFAYARAAGFLRPEYPAALQGAQREFTKAEATMEAGRGSGVVADDIDSLVVRLALAADQGQWHEVSERLALLQSAADGIGTREHYWVAGIGLSMKMLMATPHPSDISDFIRGQKSQTESGVGIDRIDARFRILFAGYLAAHSQHVDVAREAIATGESEADKHDPLLANMLVIAKAELARASGHADKNVALLKQLTTGNELYLTHVALMDTYADAKQNKAALAEARWLAGHRGDAYAEFAAHQFMTAYNVAQSDLALLRSAELLYDAGETENAKQALSQFLAVWPQARQQVQLAARIQKLGEIRVNP